MALKQMKPLSSSGLPETLLLGTFTLRVESYTTSGKYDPLRRLTTGVSGTAWVGFDCGVTAGVTFEPLEPAGRLHLIQDFEVVAEVVHAQTQISLEMARRIRPGIQVGETLELDADIAALDPRSLVRGERGLAEIFETQRERGDILVEFTDVSISAVSGKKGVGRITVGQAVYPTVLPRPKIIRLSVDGFVIFIDSLVLTPTQATGHAVLQLPAGLGSVQTCGPAQLDLGTVDITPDCQFTVERSKDTFGPWIVGDTGMVIEGTGFVLDLSDTQSLGLRAASWKGLLLATGTASGKGLVPEIANIAYLAADYAFMEAVVTATGLEGAFVLSAPADFQTSQPAGYEIHVGGGGLEVSGSGILSGWFGPGTVRIPTCAACKDAPGNQLAVDFTHLEVRSNLDLAGVLDLGTGVKVSWGELTRLGNETMAWTVTARRGYLWLPASPIASFNPETGGGFVELTLSEDPASSLAELEGEGVVGLTLYKLSKLNAFSPDRPGGVNNPLPFPRLKGWLHVGGLGVSGVIEVLEPRDQQELGDPARPGYAGAVTFKTTLFPEWKSVVLMRLIDSAVYDSRIDGFFTIGGPCKIDQLDFTDMELTSTASLVGGKVSLPSAGVKLDYWQLALVPTGDKTEAGVVSIRTGRLFFTAAGISEPVHFDQPFNLIWGELLADGNVGEFIFDHNCIGQRFDKFSFTPHHVVLSKMVPNSTDAYLAVYGSVHFNHFGAHFINIRDSRHDDANAPYFSRLVTVPKLGEAGCGPTDLSLKSTWHDSRGGDLALLDFPDAGMDYHQAAQNGFLGEGKTTLGFMHSDGLDAVIEIHIDAIDICLSSSETHDLDAGLFLRLGSMRDIHGCVRIDGPVLKRIAMFGCLEAAAATGTTILSPKAGYMVEVNLSITPNSLDFAAAGDLVLTAAGAAVDVSAAVHLFVDWRRGSAEGEVQGRIDCNSVVGGLEGEGQVTWYADSSTQYLQGKLAMEICGWTGGAGLEGGLFLGNNVPRTRAWVLYEGGDRFGISDSILPQTLTGIYGYGQLKFGVNWYIFGGGVEIFLGVGLFGPVPNIFGHCGVYVHGEILGGLVSASAWADLALRGPVPLYFEGSLGLEGCVLWFLCASIEVTAGLNSDGFYLC